MAVHMLNFIEKSGYNVIGVNFALFAHKNKYVDNISIYKNGKLMHVVADSNMEAFADRLDE
ncbi:hypothetical protein IWW39_004066, partial [Coemansia spiralis]